MITKPLHQIAGHLTHTRLDFLDEFMLSKFAQFLQQLLPDGMHVFFYILGVLLHLALKIAVGLVSFGHENFKGWIFGAGVVVAGRQNVDLFVLSKLLAVKVFVAKNIDSLQIREFLLQSILVREGAQIIVGYTDNVKAS